MVRNTIWRSQKATEGYFELSFSYFQTVFRIVWMQILRRKTFVLIITVIEKHGNIYIYCKQHTVKIRYCEVSKKLFIFISTFQHIQAIWKFKLENLFLVLHFPLSSVFLIFDVFRFSANKANKLNSENYMQYLCMHEMLFCTVSPVI